MMFENLKNLKIVYLGTPEISAECLSFLLDGGANVVAVISNEDKPVGRKGLLSPTPVKAVALDHNIPVFQPAKIKEDNAFLDELDFDIFLSMAYGQIIPEAVLSKARFGAFNLHGSLLPKYRGAAPIQRAIIDGESLTGVTLMAMVKKMDAGTMYAKKEVAIEESDNYTTLCKKIAKAAASLALDSLLDVVNRLSEGEEQKEEEVTFAAKILPEEEKLDFSLPIAKLLNKIRGLSFTPGGYCYLEGAKLKIFSAHIHSQETLGEIGEIVSDRKGLFVQAEGGVLSLDYLQLEGKKAMDGKSFVNGKQGLKGAFLS